MDPNATLAELRELLCDTEDESLSQVAEVFGALDGWLSRGGFAPQDWSRTPRVDLIHQRDPDSECRLVVYVGGVLIAHYEWSFDPGAGYDMDDFEADKRATLDAAPEFLRDRLAQIYDDMEPSYERWSL